MRHMKVVVKRGLSLLLLIVAATAVSWAQDADDNDSEVTPEREAAVALISQLGSRDFATRQHAAEELARRADTEQLKLVEGYRTQEKKDQVKVALDWALYRMGKNESLFALVRALETTQGDQAAGYLTQLDSPQPLYIFLGQTKRVVQVRLLEVLSQIGDAETLERIKPALESLEPTVSLAAENATEQINARLAQTPSEAAPTRPRQIGKSDESTP